MKKKLITTLVGIAFIFSGIMSIAAFAAGTASQDGLSATLTSAKSTYAANEDIDLTLTVINNNPYQVDGIQTRIILPEGVTAKSGTLSQTAFSLAAGETKVNSPTAVKTAAVKYSTTSAVQTGDGGSLSVWLVVMLVSGSALVLLLLRNKKLKGRSVLSLFLCFALLGGFVLPVSANALGTQKSFTVAEELNIDGTAVTITAEIYYNYLTRSPVTVESGTGSGTYAEGETVTITADAAPLGQHFVGWTVLSLGVTLADPGAAATTFTMPGMAVSIAAIYVVNTYTITASAGENGVILPAGDAAVNHGGSQEYIIAAGQGYHVADVLVDGVSVGAVSTYTFSNVTAGHTISASFAIDTFDITATAGANGTISPSGAVSVAYGGSQTYAITAEQYYHVADVLVDGMSVGAVSSYTFSNVTAEHTISASFAKDTYTVTVNNGTVQGGVYNVAWGETVTVVATAPAGHPTFLGWSLNPSGTALATPWNTTTTFTMPKSNVMLIAQFTNY